MAATGLDILQHDTDTEVQTTILKLPSIESSLRAKLDKMHEGHD